MSTFAAHSLRAKSIARWPLQLALKPTNVAEHCFESSIIALILATIESEVFNNKEISPERTCVLAMLHESSEWGGATDIAKNVKYHDKETFDAIKKVESFYEDKLLSSLDAFPPGVRKLFEPLIKQDKADPHAVLAKYADHIHALYESEKEVRLHNAEFTQPYIEQVCVVEELCAKSPACQYFMTHFYPSFHHKMDSSSEKVRKVNASFETVTI